MKKSISTLLVFSIVSTVAILPGSVFAHELTDREALQVHNQIVSLQNQRNFTRADELRDVLSHARIIDDRFSRDGRGGTFGGNFFAGGNNNYYGDRFDYRPGFRFNDISNRDNIVFSQGRGGTFGGNFFTGNNDNRFDRFDFDRNQRFNNQFYYPYNY